ncbi:GFA family protein [Leptospira gomenensis]|uniref:GFA family protein n=1 Tax=Leptospira gomenensis TaxID=2484974 RepID=A0A5F1YA80_9LEPT|nr:GFA family protein [Leptospira gomenensis]TGK32756.1 GFA family protein [Leptospira gomenensis]TGK36904.1 GFA family protein [Leptospira gomenensis]TGK44375.1 GFA family protein [Leptospira gomenensis]TGK58868.1 GFA family protein [Leptospira gomenensis]
MALKKYNGSCHCGKVSYEVDLDLSKGTTKCNCSFCAKVRNWSAMVKPEALKLLTGENELGNYQFGTKNAKHKFCKNCGVRMFTEGFVAEIGGAFVSVSLATLNDIDPVELIEAPLWFADGLHNNWRNKPEEVRHL